MPWETVGAVLWLLFCTAAILLLAWYAVRRLAAGGLGAFGVLRAGEEMKLLSRLPLGRDQALVVVQMGQRCLVLGVSPGGISLLRELSPEEVQSWTAPPEGPPPPDFRTLIEGIRQKKKGR